VGFCLGFAHDYQAEPRAAPVSGCSLRIDGAVDWQDNPLMKIFYWMMALLIVSTLLPSAFFLLLYAIKGDSVHASRARALWNMSKLFTMLGVNILIWGHVALGLWNIWFH
jgi:hypothetical protein